MYRKTVLSLSQLVSLKTQADSSTNACLCTCPLPHFPYSLHFTSCWVRKVLFKYQLFYEISSFDLDHSDLNLQITLLT